MGLSQFDSVWGIWGLWEPIVRLHPLVTAIPRTHLCDESKDPLVNRNVFFSIVERRYRQVELRVICLVYRGAGFTHSAPASANKNTVFDRFDLFRVLYYVVEMVIYHSFWEVVCPRYYFCGGRWWLHYNLGPGSHTRCSLPLSAYSRENILFVIP